MFKAETRAVYESSTLHKLWWVKEEIISIKVASIVKICCAIVCAVLAKECAHAKRGVAEKGHRQTFQILLSVGL